MRTETDEIRDNLKYLTLLSRDYPSQAAAASEIISTQALLKLPKGTEHFMSDLHGENEAFVHILNSASGVIREKVDQVLGDTVPENARAETLTMLARHPEINVLISFNEAVSVGAAQAVSDLNRADDLWMVAFDSNITTVDALHTGAVDAMVVQNTYGMGYFGVESAYKLLAGQGSSVEESTVTTTRIITRDNVFAMDKQKALFPFE